MWEILDEARNPPGLTMIKAGARESVWWKRMISVFFQFQVSELMLMFRPEGKYVCTMICMYGYIYIILRKPAGKLASCYL